MYIDTHIYIYTLDVNNVGSTPHPVTVDTESIQFYDCANANLHGLHCYRVGGFTQYIYIYT